MPPTPWCHHSYWTFPAPLTCIEYSFRHAIYTMMSQKALNIFHPSDVYGVQLQMECSGCPNNLFTVLPDELQAHTFKKILWVSLSRKTSVDNLIRIWIFSWCFYKCLIVFLLLISRVLICLEGSANASVWQEHFTSRQMLCSWWVDAIMFMVQTEAQDVSIWSSTWVTHRDHCASLGKAKCALFILYLLLSSLQVRSIL